MTTNKKLCKDLIGSFESCNTCQHDLKLECNELITHTFSFEVSCNPYGSKEIKKGLIIFLQSKNWLSKNLKIKTHI